MAIAVRARIAAWRTPALALRARDWWYFALLPLADFVDEPRRAHASAPRALLALLTAGACLAFAYGLNGITDRALDSDSAKNVLAGSSDFPRETLVLLSACVLVALSACATLELRAWAVAASLLAGGLYSAGPRLKRWPFVGTLTNLAIFLPLPLFTAALPPSAEHALLLATFALLLGQSQLVHELADAADDARGGVRTTAVVVGATGRRWLALVLGPLCGAALFLLGAPRGAAWLAFLAVGGGAVFLWVATPTSAARARVRHRWFSLVVGAALFALLVGVRP